MKNQLVLIFLLVSLSTISTKAQNSNNNNNNNNNNRNNSGLALNLGASVNYYYGQGSRNFGQFENNRVNWQLNGMLGITVARDKGGRRSMIAGFGTYGFNNKNTISEIFKDQRYTTLALDQSAANNFYQLEGGLLLAEVLRISTGVGQQNFNGQPLVSPNGIQTNVTFLKYNSSTVGLNLNLSSIAWVINCNFAYGQDFNRTVITPSTGLMLRF